MNDPVHHPSHYQMPSGKEVIEIIKERLNQTELTPFASYCYGNAIKYLMRAPNKGALEDYKKARVYLNWLIEEIEGYDK